MRSLALWQRLSVCFAALLVACSAAAGALQMAQSLRQGQQTEQRLLRQLATHIAAETQGMHGSEEGPDPLKLAAFVERLRLTNPGIELYVLDAQGRIMLRHPSSGLLQRDSVDLGPLRDFIAGKAPPLLGDDPLVERGRKVFSAAPWAGPGMPAGYIYAVLQGSAYDHAASVANRDAAIEVALWSIGLVAPLGLLAGLAAFRLVTRPLSALTHEVEQLERQSRRGSDEALSALPNDRPPGDDEIAILREAFRRLAATNEAQRERLAQQDRQRRELVASISHDLRTPLASLQGYLETLLLKASQLSAGEREHYLRTALSQCQAVGRLAGELLDLARLELGVIKPANERFSLADLVHDVVQKLALASAARRQQVEVRVPRAVPEVLADIGMIERVLSNLLDNAIRHSPAGGTIAIELRELGSRVEVEVADSGPGIEPALQDSVFVSPAERRADQAGGGLGLVIVRQILRLQGDDIRIEKRPGAGAVFVFGVRRAGG